MANHLKGTMQHPPCQRITPHNGMGCPVSRFSRIYDANAWAQRAGKYFRLPSGAFIEIIAIDPNYLRDPEEQFQYGPNLLNRKFKMVRTCWVKARVGS